MPALRESDDPVDLAVGALAVYRLTRLVVTDEVARPLRQAVDARSDGGAGSYFITCPWCVSLWLGAGWVALRRLAPRTARTAGAALASSAVAGLLASWE